MFIEPHGNDPTARRKTVEVHSSEQYDANLPPENLLEFKTWLDGLIAQIPDEFRASAEIEIGSVSDWGDSHYGTVTISYARPETPGEIAERIADWNEKVAQREAQERAAYERLHAKFG